MKDKLQQLKKDYELKMQSLFDTEQDTDLQVLRAAVKISCYRSFIVEIEKILNDN